MHVNLQRSEMREIKKTYVYRVLTYSCVCKPTNCKCAFRNERNEKEKHMPIAIEAWKPWDLRFLLVGEGGGVQLLEI